MKSIKGLTPLSSIDFYKGGHKPQYTPGTELVYSGFTPRSDRIFKNMLPKRALSTWDSKIVFAGITAFCKEFFIDFWNEGFFFLPLEEVVAEYQLTMDTSLGEGSVKMDHIIALHNLGYLPLHVKALEEGSRVNIGVPTFTVVNTHPDFFWLTNYAEDVLSVQNWKICTIATIAYEFRRSFEYYADFTGSPIEFVDYQGHDFSFRGMSALEDAARNNIGHLLSFYGTDTVPAINYARAYYNADPRTEIIGSSIPATEHSVMCMGGMEDELETFRHILSLYPTGAVSIVSDTWDFWDTLTVKAAILKPEIMARQKNEFGLCKTVFRPDSGDPIRIIAGYEAHEYTVDGDGTFFCNTTKEQLTEAEVLGAVECLWRIFGGTVTDKGFRVLDEHVGLIYGDSINLYRQDEILRILAAKGYASCNIVFGIGSFTYQYITRDVFGWAMKATYGVVNGVPRNLLKEPKTGDGTKKSATGLLRVEKEGKDYVLYQAQTPEQEKLGELKSVFLNSQLIRDVFLKDVRARLKAE